MFRMIRGLFCKKPKVKCSQEQKQESATHWEIGLPSELMQHCLFGYHSPDEAKNLAEVSDVAYVAYELPLFALNFVEHVVKGEQQMAEKILQDNPKLQSYLLSQPVSVKDYSGRTFFNITAFQYAIWALDRHMWTMLKKFMPIKEMKKQLENMEYSGGIEYQLPVPEDEKSEYKTEIRREMHYDFSQLIEALSKYNKEYLKYYGDPQETYDRKDVEAALKSLGLVQCDVPAHVANEYCSPEQYHKDLVKLYTQHPFVTINFKEHPYLYRTCEVVNTRINKFSPSERTWFQIAAKGKKLNIPFAFFRDNYIHAYVSNGRGSSGGYDKRIMEALFEDRTLELAELKDSLFPKKSLSFQRNRI